MVLSRNNESSEGAFMGGGTKGPYIAILVYMTEVEGGYAHPRYSEDIVLIYEDSIEKARATAEEMGRGEETSYQNKYDETVCWKFVGIADVCSALYENISENITLYSRSFDDLSQYKNVFSISSLSDEKGAGGEVQR
jgi:hypothetical protein